MSEGPIFFIEDESGDFIVVDEYGDPILDENGKEIEYTGKKYKEVDKVYINTNRANNYVLDYGDNKYKKGGRSRFDKKNYRGNQKYYKKK